MPNADSSRVGLAYSFETNWGETPVGPTMKTARLTSPSPAYNRNMIMSNELRSDRNVPDLIEAGVTVEGGFNFEFSAKSFDDFLAAAFCSDWVVKSVAALTLTFNSGTKTITRSAGSWLADLGAAAVINGTWVRVTVGPANAGNKKAFRISTSVAPTALVLTVDDPNNDIVTEGPTGGMTLTQNYLRNGIVKKSFLVEEQFPDIGKYRYFTGCRVREFTLDLASQAIAIGSVSLYGKLGVNGSATVAGSQSAASSTGVFSASSHLGDIRKDGIALAAGLRRMNLRISTGAYTQPLIGSKYTSDVGLGREEITVSLEAMFPDMALLDAIVNDSKMALSFKFEDIASPLSNVVIFSLPALKGRGNPNVPGNNQPVTLPFDGQAVLDSVTGCQIQVDSL